MVPAREAGRKERHRGDIFAAPSRTDSLRSPPPWGRWPCKSSRIASVNNLSRGGSGCAWESN